MPFYTKGGDDSEMVYVTGGNENGNYGNFACDFVLVNAFSKTNPDTGLDEMIRTEISRLRYVDIIRNYNKSKELLRKGTIVKKAKYTDSVIDFYDCVNDRYPTTETEGTKWIEKFYENVSIYDCKILDGAYFVYDIEKGYILNPLFIEIRDNVQELLDNNEEVDNESMLIYEKINEIQDIENDDNIVFGILISDYDFLLKCNNDWERWWSDGWGQSTYFSYYNRWENYVFDYNYDTSLTALNPFKFLKDVETYLLGKIYVPEEFGGHKIDGRKVPEVVTTLTFNNYKQWFVENEAASFENPQLRKEWDDRGGDAFFDFLSSITPKFMHEMQEPTHGKEIYFTYAVPNIEISLQIIDEHMYETEYTPYEYSIDINGYTVDGTYEYVAPTTGIGSGLTPAFAEYERGEIRCESKLGYVCSDDCFWVSDEISGVFSEFTHGCCLFKCTFYSGNSSSPQIRRVTEKKTYNYRYLNGEIVLVGISDPEIIDDEIIQEEVKPLVKGSNVYQVVGIKLTATTMDDILTGTTTEYEYINDTENIAAEYTYYDYCTEHSYTWWECSRVPTALWDEYTCSDGEYLTLVQATGNTYKNVLILSCMPYLVNEEMYGWYCYFMAKYDNGNVNRLQGEAIDEIRTIRALDIPYIIDVPMNEQSLSGEWSGTIIYDTVISREVADGMIDITYVIGKTSGVSEDTGIVYAERYNYEENCSDIVLLDGLYEGEIYYNKLFKGEGTEVYSEDYNLTRKTHIADVIGMEIGTQWTSASCLNAPLITEETTDGLIDTPNIEVSISFDRGAAAGWEHHFKLSECNTLEDLENYGNGAFFNS